MQYCLNMQLKWNEEQPLQKLQQNLQGKVSLAEKEREIGELREKLQEKHQQLQGKDRFICPHQWEVREKHRQLQERQWQLREKVARIKVVEEEGRVSAALLEKKEREIRELREQLEQNEERFHKTVQQLAEAHDTVRANEQQLQQKDQQIREKGTRIETVERENFMLKEAERRLREMKDAELQSVRREVVDLQQLLAHFQRLDLQTQDTAPQEVSTGLGGQYNCIHRCTQ